MKTQKLFVLISTLFIAGCAYGQSQVIKLKIESGGKITTHSVTVDEKHRLLNAYASAEELKNPYVAATLQTLGELSADQRTLTLPEGTTVYVAPGVYWTDQTYRQGFPFDDSGFVIPSPNVGLSILGANISFIGLTADATDVHICGNRGEGGAKGLGANGSWYSLAVSTGFRAENITIANYAQEDLVYPRDPSQNISKRIQSTNHAEVLRPAEASIDRIYFENVRFIGFLNMMAGFSPARAYFKDCVLQCTDDAVFGGHINVYQNCTFRLYGSHPSYNGAGAGGVNVLLGCKIIGMPQVSDTCLYLCKSSRGNGADATTIFALIDNEFLGRIETVEWENVVREDARHAVSNNTIGEGKQPLVVSPAKPQTSVTYTGDALNAFKVGNRYNVYNLLKGDDGWDPAGQNTAGWAPYANLPFRFLIGVNNTTLYSDQTGADNTAVLTPAPVPASSVDAGKTVWTYNKDLLNGEVNPSTGVLTLTAKPNRTGAIIKTVVTGTLPNGIPAGATLYIRPVPVASPVLTSPAIAIGKNTATLDYTLNHPEYKDVSMIEWYRETGPTTTNGIHIGTMKSDAEGRFVDAPYKTYALDTYDVGYYLRAVITPKYAFSPAAASSITVYSKRAITSADITGTLLYTDFKNLYITTESNLTTTGRWFFDNEGETEEPWGWGIGSNGADGIWGLQNNTRVLTPPRFVFAQPGRYGDMSLTLNYSSGKVEGQGFGGSGCYLDIYIKYDAVTRTGYGLRIERVPASTSGTQWTLYRYDGENQTALTSGILAAAFMPQSTLTVSVTGNTLRVVASTQSKITPLQVEQNLSNKVDISWTDATGALGKDVFGGFGFRIYNSGNASYQYGNAGTNNCVMLHNVKINADSK